MRRFRDLLTSSSSDNETEEMHHLSDSIQVVIPPGTTVPMRGTPGSAGWDLRSNQSVTLHPGRVTRVDLGLRLTMPPSYAMLLVSRSRLAAEGISTQGGLIDSDYTGPVTALLFNSTTTPRRITKGERVTQALFLPVPEVEWLHGPLQKTLETSGALAVLGLRSWVTSPMEPPTPDE